MKRAFVTCVLAVVAAITAAWAGPAQPVPTVAPQDSSEAFSKGAKEFENVIGPYFFFDTTHNDRPSVDFLVDSLRFGIMLNNPRGSGFLSGNFEFLGEIFGAGIFDGPGNVMAGSNLIFRYNFIQSHSRVIPYMQIGAGLVYTDISESESHGLVSLPVEFDLQGLGGLRYMLNDRWSLRLEGSYRHISNATIKLPNYGIDSVGGNVGFGFSF